MFCTRRGHGNPVFRKKSRGPRPGTTQRRYEAGGYNDEYTNLYIYDITDDPTSDDLTSYLRYFYLSEVLLFNTSDLR